MSAEPYEGRLAPHWRREVVKEPWLTPAQKVVAQAIGDRTNADGSRYFCGAEYLSTQIGISDKTIRKTYRDLERESWLKYERMRGRAKEWRLTLPDSRNSYSRNSESAYSRNSGTADSRNSGAANSRNSLPATEGPRRTEEGSDPLQGHDRDQDSLDVPGGAGTTPVVTRDREESSDEEMSDQEFEDLLAEIEASDQEVLTSPSCTCWPGEDSADPECPKHG